MKNLAEVRERNLSGTTLPKEARKHPQSLLLQLLFLGHLPQFLELTTLFHPSILDYPAQTSFLPPHQ